MWQIVLNFWQWALTNPIMHGVLTGLGGAVIVDLIAFRSFQGWSDLEAHWSLSVASWRWFQGALGGFLTSLGIAGASAATGVATGLALYLLKFW